MDKTSLYLIEYLAVGSFVLLVMRIYIKFQKFEDKRSQFVRDMLKAVEESFPKEKTLREKLAPYPMYLLVWFAWPVAALIGIAEIRKKRKEQVGTADEEIQKYSEKDLEGSEDDQDDEDKDFVCSMGDLVRKVTVMEAEKSAMITDPLGRTPALPFGHLNPIWRKFIEKLDGDVELWYFENIGVPIKQVFGEKGLNWNYPHNIVRGYAIIKPRTVTKSFILDEFIYEAGGDL